MSGTYDGIVVGGGIVGLAITYELTRRGQRILLLDRQAVGREASWAGAGILPPGSWYTDDAWAEELAALSAGRYANWMAELREFSGIDPEYQRCGAVYFATNAAAAQRLSVKMKRWTTLGIESYPLDDQQLSEVEPILTPDVLRHAAHYVPGEAQVRNPRLLSAAAKAVTRLGAAIETDSQVREIIVERGRAVGVATVSGRRNAGYVCLAAGAWQSQLLADLGVDLPIWPVRGQMQLLQQEQQSLSAIVHQVAGDAAGVDNMYVVPRGDGKTLVGSTIEDVGFDKSTEPQVLERFQRFAAYLNSSLAAAKPAAAWSGLRPASVDGRPIIGPVPGIDRLFVAAGHFRAGLQFAPPTASLIGSMVGGEPPPFDPHPYRVDR